jgi:hypothetical protein
VTDEEKANGAQGAGEVTEVTQAVSAEEETTIVAASADEAKATATAQPGPGAGAGAVASGRRPSRLRRALVVVLVVLSCIGVVVTGLTWWSHYTLMNTDGFMKVVGPIAKDPQAIQNLSTYISDQVIQASDLQQRLTDALPSQLQVLAGPLTGYVEGLITKGTTKVLSSQQAYDLWLKIVEKGHEQVVAMLRGENTTLYA